MNSDDYLTQGSDHYAAGRLDDALAAWEEGLRVVPHCADLHYNVGLGLSKSGQPAEATHHWREAIRLRPDFYAPHYAMLVQVVERIRAGKRKALWHEARSLCRQTLALDTAKADHRAYLLRLLGQAEWHLGDREAALKTTARAIEAAPDDYRGYDRLGFMQKKMGAWLTAWRTIWGMVAMPSYEDSPRWRRIEHDTKIGAGVLGLAVVSGVLLTWKLTRRG